MKKSLWNEIQDILMNAFATHVGHRPFPANKATDEIMEAIKSRLPKPYKGNLENNWRQAEIRNEVLSEVKRLFDE